MRALLTGQILAFITAAHGPGGRTRALLLVVDPAHTREGLRRALRREVQHVLNAEGARNVTIEVGFHDNPAVAFYRKEGLEIEGLEEAPDPQDERVLLTQALLSA